MVVPSVSQHCLLHVVPIRRCRSQENSLSPSDDLLERYDHDVSVSLLTKGTICLLSIAIDCDML